jgi:hypothetical protein
MADYTEQNITTPFFSRTCPSLTVRRVLLLKPTMQMHLYPCLIKRSRLSPDPAARWQKVRISCRTDSSAGDGSNRTRQSLKKPLLTTDYRESTTNSELSIAKNSKHHDGAACVLPCTSRISQLLHQLTGTLKRWSKSIRSKFGQSRCLCTSTSKYVNTARVAASSRSPTCQHCRDKNFLSWTRILIRLA